MQPVALQFWQGFTAPLRGLLVVARHPRLWVLTLLPILLTAALLTLALVGAVLGVDPLLHRLFPSLLPGLPYTFVRLVAGVLLGIALGTTAYMVALVLTIPIHDRLGEAVERALGAHAAPLGLTESIVLSVRHSIAGFALWLTIESFLLPLPLLPVVGPPLAATLGYLSTVWFLAHHLLDGPMSRRAMRFRQKMRFLYDHLPWIAGLGVAGTLVVPVPFLNLVALPLLIAGGATLWVELERDRAPASDVSCGERTPMLSPSG